MSDNGKILVLGTNPAWQKRLTFRQLNLKQVNRAAAMEQFASGKGINFCRAMKCFGVTELELLHFLGGANGEKIRNYLSSEEIYHLAIPISGETRCCITMKNSADGETTEIIEPSSQVSQLEYDSFLAAMEQKIPQSAGCAVCGSPPDNKSEQLYFAAAALTYRQRKIFFVDYYKNLDKIYAANPQTILKINQIELAAATGERDIISALRILSEKFGAILSIITAGAEQVYLQDHEKIYRATVPPVDPVINPIGCGDTFGGVFLAQYLQSGDLLTAFRYGIAAGSANCLTPLCGDFRLSDLGQLLQNIKVELV